MKNARRSNAEGPGGQGCAQSFEGAGGHDSRRVHPDARSGPRTGLNRPGRRGAGRPQVLHPQDPRRGASQALFRRTRRAACAFHAAARFRMRCERPVEVFARAVIDQRRERAIRGPTPASATPICPLQSRGQAAKWPASADVAQLVRALDCGSRGPPFEPGRRYHPPFATRTSRTRRDAAPAGRGTPPSRSRPALSRGRCSVAARARRQGR